MPEATPAGEEDPLAGLLGFAALAVILGYEWGMTWWRGATIGKYALGIQVASAHDARSPSGLVRRSGCPSSCCCGACCFRESWISARGRRIRRDEPGTTG